MKQLLISFIICVALVCGGVTAQEFNILFYNLENLFDTQDDVGKNDEEYLPEADKEWDSIKFNIKCGNIVKVLATLDQKPKVFGFSEVENINALNNLLSLSYFENYRGLLIEGPDHRGIDCAIVYDTNFLQLDNVKSYPTINVNDTSWKTRDQLVASLRIKENNTLFSMVVAHWPSRRGGKLISNPKRKIAAELGAHICDSLDQLKDISAVFYMGDLNDDPIDASVKKHLVLKANLYNPFLDFFKKGEGTLAWGDTWNLFDQILIKDKSALQNVFIRAEIINPDFLFQEEGRFCGYPKRSFVGNTFNEDGFSDHFPVQITIQL